MSAPNMTPNMQNDGRWHHIASELEIKAAMRDKNADVIEVPAIGISFLSSASTLTCVRTGIMGGDVRDVQGGWVYPNAIAFAMDREEWRDLQSGTRGMRE